MTEQVPRELWRQGACPHQASEENEKGGMRKAFGEQLEWTASVLALP